MKNLSRAQLWDYFLLSARILLAWTLIRYGWAKLTDNQFGVDEKTLSKPLKDIGLFNLSWYLANHEPFKSFIGGSQIATGLTMIWSRTVNIGAFMSIPIWLNILFWDWTFMENMSGIFIFRISFYLLLTALILIHHKVQVYPAITGLTQVPGKFSYPIWAYLILPVTAIGVEILGGLLRWLPGLSF